MAKLVKESLNSYLNEKMIFDEKFSKLDDIVINNKEITGKKRISAVIHEIDYKSRKAKVKDGNGKFYIVNIDKDIRNHRF